MDLSPAIRVEEYDQAWGEAFRRLCERLWPAVAAHALRIEHVGSTSVPGLAAKPIIDLDIVVASLQRLPAVESALAGLGYEARGDLGIAERFAFRAPSGPPAHHLYVCVEGSVALRNHLALRDHLRTHPEAVHAYGRLKMALAARYPHDIEHYVEGKTEFILGLLAGSGLSPEQADGIRAANRARDSR